MTITTINKDKFELKKHIAAIHCHGKITLLQRKIANALLFHAYHNLMTQEEHVIQISELTKLVGFDSNDHRKVKDALLKLLSTVIEWNVIDELSEDSEIWNASSIISDVSIRGSICRYSYSNKMRKLLYHPVRYGKIDLNIQTKFQSSYGLTLYENCNRYKSIGNTPWFDLETFKKLMGVENGLYKIFRDLNNRVIKKAVEEVNQYTLMSVEPEFKKLNRQVVSLRFLIKQKKQQNSILDQDTSNELIDKLKQKFGFSSKQVDEVFKQFDKLYIEEKINLITNSEPYKNGVIRNLSKYLMAALKDDYKSPVSSKEHIDNFKKNDIFSKKNIEEYELFKRKYIDNMFNNLSEIEKKSLVQQFQAKIKKTVYFSLFETNGMENVLIKDRFHIFLQEVMQSVEMPSIEMFFQQKEKLNMEEVME
ncbi:Initiator Replication protein [Legionella cherrii]|uniref:Initiator Replication protein n=1 Tax=Legionella cherrii TaxID=28084 RepID=A0A0W0SJD9_9GAMM|nr:replication initiation protein [Legionella cherrii]KTC83380.1 Initiator Replication protein [Legionella cherrii]